MANSKNAGGRFKRFVNWVSWPLLASWLTALAACVGLFFSIRNNTASEEEKIRFQWQRTIVYRIIDEATRDTGLTISFSEITDKYNIEAGREEKVRLSKKDLQELEIQRILMSLEIDKLIGHTTEKRYYIYRNNPCGNELTPAGGLAQKKILQLLKSHPGKFSVDELYTELRRDISITDEEYGLVINCLLSRQYVAIWNNKLYSHAYPPTTVPPILPAGEPIKVPEKIKPHT